MKTLKLEIRQDQDTFLSDIHAFKLDFTVTKHDTFLKELASLKELL